MNHLLVLIGLKVLNGERITNQMPDVSQESDDGNLGGDTIGHTEAASPP